MFSHHVAASVEKRHPAARHRANPPARPAARSRYARWVVLLIGCSFAWAPAVSAANASKQATKSLKNDTAAALATFKKSAKAQRKQLSASLAVVDLKLKQGNGSLNDIATVYDALKTFQTSLGALMNDTGSDLFLAFHAAKNILTDGGVTDLPKGFRFGEGGLVDKYRRNVLSAIDDVLQQAQERALKTAGLFKKHANVGMCVRLAHPRNLHENPGTGSTSFTPLQHTLGILLSGRNLAVPDNGWIYLWGNCFSGDDLTLKAFVSDGPSVTVTPNPAAGNSWEYALFGMDSGYYTFKLSATGAIGGGGYGSISVP